MQGKYRATGPRRKRLEVPRPARRKEGISENSPKLRFSFPETFPRREATRAMSSVYNAIALPSFAKFLQNGKACREKTNQKTAARGDRTVVST
jgi:hypothetical protein